jgi:hypothetical protein
MIKLSARGPRVLAVGAIVAASIGLLRPSHAGADPSTASIVVPRGGLAFRTPEGKVLARLSSDTEGGVLELYDAHEQPTAAWRGGASVARGAAGPEWTPGGLDEEVRDPWRTSPKRASFNGGGL